ncbi:MAG: hypothetical protein AMXMBFR33_13190 [Candidatus Xenobia bacterium]
MGGMMLLVEGLDLAGKSSLVPELARRFEKQGLEVRLARNCLCPDNPVAREADRLRQDLERDPDRAAMLFVAAHMWDAAHFVLPGPGQVHLQDSCWLRTLAWEEWHGRAELAALLRQATKFFPRFDQTIYLTASLPERQRRYFLRRKNDCGDRLVLDAPEEFARLEACLRREAGHLGAVTLDNSQLTIAQTQDQAWQILTSAGESRPLRRSPSPRRPRESRA